MSEHGKKISRLDRQGEENRAEIATDLAAVRERVENWKRRGGVWLQIAAVAAAAAGAGLASFSLVRRIRRNRAGSLAAKWGRSIRRADSRIQKYQTRPLPITLLFALLRSPLVRRALASGGERIAAATVERKDRPGSDDKTPDTDREARKPVELQSSKSDGEKKTPPASEKAGEQKAKRSIEALKRASWGERFRFIWELFRDAFKDFQKHEALTRGAALAYSTMLSLAPLLIIVVAVAGLAFGKDAVRERLLAQVGQLVGPQAAATVGGLMQQASKPATGIIATVLGLATLLFGAGGVFGYLQQMLNKIWGVPEKATGGIWNLIRSRFLSLAMVLGTGFLLLVSLVISAALSAVGKKAGEEVTFLFGALHALFSWAVVALLFALIFKFLPDTKIAWRDVWIGAGITSLLFVLGQFLIGLYLGRISGPYGGAGSLVVVLLWTYYSGLILFFGAEITQVFANRHGSRK